MANGDVEARVDVGDMPRPVGLSPALPPVLGNASRSSMMEEELTAWGAEIIMMPRCFPRFAIFPNRFRSEALEKSFVLDQKMGMIATIIFASKVLFGCSVVFGIQQGGIQINPVGRPAYQFCFFLRIIQGVICLSTWRCAIFFTERLLVTLTSIMILSVLIGGNYRAAYFSGDDPYTAWQGQLPTDTLTVQLISCVICGFFVLLPIRCRISWIFSLVVPTLYAACTLPLPADGPEPSLVQRLMVVAALFLTTLTGLFGRAHLETQQRYQFARHWQSQSALVDERVRRYQAEHASELRAAKEEQGCAQSVHGSVAGTDISTAIGRIVHDLELQRQAVAADDSSLEHFDVLSQLEEMADIARKEYWLVNLKDLELIPGGQLGSGSYGVVVRGMLHGTVVAVKLFKSLELRGRVESLASFANELRVLRRVRHPNIVFFYGACFDPGKSVIAIVLEYVDGMSLVSYVLSKPTAPSSLARCQLIFDLCCALRCLHGQISCIVHGDLKPDNVLVEFLMNPSESKSYQPRPRAKLLDFGLSRLMTKRAQPLGGTYRWMAPEVLCRADTTPTQHADIFSLACTNYFIATGLRPREGLDLAEITSMALYEETLNLIWPDIPLRCEFQNLCTPSLRRDPSARPPIQEVYNAAKALLELWTTEGSAHDELVFESLRPTSTEAILSLLLGAIDCINFHQRASECCVMHSGMRVIAEIAFQFGQSACMQTSGDTCLQASQCIQCGLINKYFSARLDASACGACGGECIISQQGCQSTSAHTLAQLLHISLSSSDSSASKALCSL